MTMVIVAVGVVVLVVAADVDGEQPHHGVGQDNVAGRPEIDSRRAATILGCYKATSPTAAFKDAGVE